MDLYSLTWLRVDEHGNVVREVCTFNSLSLLNFFTKEYEIDTIAIKGTVRFSHDKY